MLPIAKPPLTYHQKATALIVAGVVDFLQITALPLLGLGYVLDDLLDVLAAIVLTAICGFKWQFVLAFAFELVPGLDLFPSWTAVILLLPTHAPEATSGAIQRRAPVEVQAVVVPPVVATKKQMDGTATDGSWAAQI